MGGEGKQMHVVMLVLPGVGNINPMLQASLNLASMGVKVTLVNSEYNQTHMKLPSLASSPAASSSSTMEADAAEPSIPSIHNISFLYIPDGLPPEHGRSTNMGEWLASLDACYGPAFELLMQRLVLQDPPPTCIICSTFLSHVQDAAKRLRLPFVSCWTQSAASYASLLLLAKGKVPPKDAVLSDTIACDLLAPGIPPHIKYEEFNAFLLAHEPDNFVFKLLVSPFKTIMEADGILMNTFEELEPETMAFLKGEGHAVFPVGPLLPCSFFNSERASEDGVEWIADEESGKTCPLRWLDNQEAHSVIYVSFGSVAMMNAEQTKELAMGLEASNQSFLWVLRQCGEKAKKEQLPEGFLERTSERGLVIQWAPQLRVLQHKAVGGFLTHCGWNSTLESISAGVPLLGWPFLSDQGLNRRCIVDRWHVGLSLEKAEESASLVSRVEIQKKVVELLHGDAGKVVQANAKKWGATAINAASHTDGSSVINFQCFVDRLGQL